MINYIEEYKKIFEGGKFIRNDKEITLSDYRAFDGGGIRPLIDQLISEVEKRGSATILDYGCGEALHWHQKTLHNRTKNLTEVLGDKLRGFYRYDPSYTLYDRKPTGLYDIVVCTDVLEHVPDHEVENLIKTIDSYLVPGGIAMYAISTIPSRNVFLDGTNMHINLKSKEEWYTLISSITTKGCLLKF